MTYIPEQSTCDSPQGQSSNTFSISNGNLTLCNSTQCAVYSPQSCQPAAAGTIITLGCTMNNGPFVAHALGPIPPGDGG